MGFRDRAKKKMKTLGSKQQFRAENPRADKVWPTVIDKSKLPQGVQEWYPKLGDNLIDILPWEAGNDMPLDANFIKTSEEGDLEFEMELFVHTEVGTRKEVYTCPYANFGEACPICEEMESHGYVEDKQFYTDVILPMKPKHRVFYLVWDHSSKDAEAKGVQIWNASEYVFKQQIDPLAKNPKTGGVELFYDPDEGKTLMFTGTKGPKGKKFTGFRFLERDDVIPDEILDKVFAIDSAIKMHPSYDEIEKMFKGRKATETQEVPEQEEQEPNPNDTDLSSFENHDVGELPEFSDEELPEPTKMRRKPKFRK